MVNGKDKQNATFKTEIKNELIKIEYLDNNSENNEIVSELIAKDVDGKCFSNKDTEGNIVPTTEMAAIYLEYAKMFVIKYSNTNIGLLSLTNDNEISIFIEPRFQKQGIGQYCLVLFEKMLKEQYGLETLVAEITQDNEESIKLFNRNGFLSTNECREVPINDVLLKVIKYVKKL